MILRRNIICRLMQEETATPPSLTNGELFMEVLLVGQFLKKISGRIQILLTHGVLLNFAEVMVW